MADLRPGLPASINSTSSASASASTSPSHKHTSRKLTKKPRAGSSVAAAAVSATQTQATSPPSEVQVRQSLLRSPTSSSNLRRAPSAPHTKSTPQYTHTRKTTSPNPASYTSSNSSLERVAGPSPVSASFDQGGVLNQHHTTPTTTRLTLTDQSSQELIGAPFDGFGILSHIDSTKATGYQNSLRRPAPPATAHTAAIGMNPPLRQSSSFSSSDKMAEKTASRSSDGNSTGGKRYSDEPKDPKAGMGRKKSGFSGMMSNILGTPRAPKISAPENPVHVTHVGYDNQTGQFTVSIATKSSGKRVC